MTRRRLTGIGLFCAIGAGSAALVITLAGTPEDTPVDRVLRSAALAGAFVGLWLAPRLNSREPRAIVGRGASAGLLLHPVMWFFYVNMRSVADGLSVGEYLGAWVDIFKYSVASIPQGGAITIPLSLAGAWILARLVPDGGELIGESPPTPESPDGQSSEGS